MPSNKDVEDNIRSLMGERKPRAPAGAKTYHNNDQVNIDNVSGHIGNVVVGDNNAIIINDTRRPGERIDEDQQQEIREGIESLVKVDCLLASRNPKDTRTHDQRRASARRKRWHALRREFRVSSFTRLTQAQFDDALAWPEKQKQAALDQLGPPAKDQSKRKPSFKRTGRLLALLLVALVVPLLFSVSGTHMPPPTISGPIAAITVDKAPPIQPAAINVSPSEPVFEFHTGCTFFRPAKPIHPFTSNRPHNI